MVRSALQCFRISVCAFLIAGFLLTNGFAQDRKAVFADVRSSTEIAQKPLSVSGSVAPNVLLMLDNSESMTSDAVWRPSWNMCAYMDPNPVVFQGRPLEDEKKRNVCFFSELHYKGRKECFANGTSMSVVAVKSIRLRPGYSVKVFNANNYDGVNKSILKNRTDFLRGTNMKRLATVTNVISKKEENFKTIKSFQVFRNTSVLTDVSCGGFSQQDYVMGNKSLSGIDDVEENYNITDLKEYEEGGGDWRPFSSDFNAVYYNPEIKYFPWNGMSRANFRKAKENPASSNEGDDNIKDLFGRFYVVATDSAGYIGKRPNRFGQVNYQSGANEVVDWWDDHIIYQILSDRIRSWKISFIFDKDTFGPDVARRVESLDDIIDDKKVVEIQKNYANWYQYYRSRGLRVIGTSVNIVKLFPSMRYASKSINKTGLLVDFPSTVFGHPSHNDVIIKSIMGLKFTGGTPLPKALKEAGDIYKKLPKALKETGDIYKNSASNVPIINECQMNYAVLLTDGEWYGKSTVGDLDTDGNSGFISDVAYYNYKNDLRSDLADVVPLMRKNTNNKQHMITLGVSFGKMGNLRDTDNDGWPNPVLTRSADWGQGNRIDDLWHAGFNSDGAYFSAYNASLIKNIKRIFNQVASSETRISQVSVGDKQIMQNGRYVFQSKFNAKDWSGDLTAVVIKANGVAEENPDGSLKISWSAQKRFAAQGVDGWNNRTIITRNSSGGVPFKDSKALMIPAVTRANINVAGKAYWDQVLNYIRGNQAYEGDNGFRKRSSKLGDIVNSVPFYVGAPKFNYRDDISKGSFYSAFKAAYKDRSPMVFVGANDGMLHGFDAETGAEKLAYVPEVLTQRLHDLVFPNYGHRFYVDASPTVTDVYVNDKRTFSIHAGSWKSVLVGGLGAGGRAIYALDVTDPKLFSEDNASKLSLWEFSHLDDPDLGYTFGKPVITKLASGDWVAIFNNGYDSTEENDDISGDDSKKKANGEAILYIVDINDGTLIKKISTKAGSRDVPNGLSPITAIDTNADSVTDFVYAGDLHGNMWKFDLTSTKSSDWGVAFDNGGNPRPLFRTGLEKPITGKPAVGRHPNGGYLVYFGSGSYFRDIDNSRIKTQSVYAVWDKAEAYDLQLPIVESDLLKQAIINEFKVKVKSGVVSLRQTTNEAIDWDTHKGWTMDLKVKNSDSQSGERSVMSPILQNGQVTFNTHMPVVSGVCSGGGESWELKLDAKSGARLEGVAFDVNEDGKLDKNDQLYSKMGSLFHPSDPNAPSDSIVAGGIKTDGIVTQNTIVIPCGRSECRLTIGAQGRMKTDLIKNEQAKAGRQSWRQIILEDE